MNRNSARTAADASIRSRKASGVMPPSRKAASIAAACESLVHAGDKVVSMMLAFLTVPQVLVIG
jgi:hypothetical protein